MSEAPVMEPPMRGMAASRRAVLGAMAVLPGLAVAPRAQAAAGFRFILDARLPEATAIRTWADAAGHPCADPGGEIVECAAHVVVALRGHEGVGVVGPVEEDAGERPLLDAA